MAGEKFRLNFISDGFGKVDIDEPFGYNALSFDFIQKDKGYARDIFFNGGESEMEFTVERNHYVDKLIYYNHYYGFESEVELEIEFPTGLIITHDLDFSDSSTDDFEYLKCKMIQKTEIMIVKRKSGVKVDLFSKEDINGDPIAEIPTSQILIKPKAILERSKWEQVEFNGVYLETRGGRETREYQANPCQIIVQFDIDNTLSSLMPYEGLRTPSSYYILEAMNQMTNTRIRIPKGLHIDIQTGTDQGGKGYVDFYLFCIYGKDEASGTRKTLITAYIDAKPDQNWTLPPLTNDIVIDIPLLERGDKVWLYFQWKIRQSASQPLFGVKPVAYCRTTITGMSIVAEATTSTYFSVVTGIRLIDAIKQVVKSISGKEVEAPMFNVGRQYYNTFLLNGNLLRGITGKSKNQGDPTKIDRAFYLSLDDISDSITECNADYEVNDAVFFGNEEYFYTATECGFFDTTQFQEFSKTYNPRMKINEFSFKYKNFQALKENEIPQTADTIHGEIILSFFNKNVENKKEVTVEWIRDGFLFEEARSKALALTVETSYQDDNKIFALDTTLRLQSEKYRETAELNHVYNQSKNNLTLKSNSINFVLMGIEVASKFKILAPDKNAGNYIVAKVKTTELEINIDFTSAPPFASPNGNNNGIRKTAFEFTISYISVPLTNYTTQGITNISGINDPESYSNQRFSCKKNIQRYFSEYLATCNSYWKDEPIKVTWYKNNKEYTSTYLGMTTLEGAEITPTEKILSPYLYQNVVFANVELDEFFTLQTELRTKRGFIRTIDKNSNVIKLFPTKMSYKIMSKELTITGEDKFEPAQMTISTVNLEILINNETSLHTLDYEIKDDKLFVYDNHRQLLYNGVFWDKVSINGAYAESQSELDDLMKLVQSKNN